MRAARATAYSPAPGGFRVSMSEWEQTGDGAVHTSIEDLIRWDENFYNATVGGRGLIDALERIDTLTNGTALTYARGLMVDDYRGLRRVSHGGAWAGYRAELMRIPAKHLSVAVLCNRADGGPTQLAQRVLDLYLGDLPVTAKAAAPVATPTRVAVTEEALRRWTGRYRNPATGNMRPVVLENGKLLAQFGAAREELVPTGEAEFYVDLQGSLLTLRMEGAAGSRRMRQFLNGRETALFEELTDVALTDADRAALAGTYRSAELQATFTIAQQGTAMTMSMVRGVIPMQPIKPDLWSAGPFSLRITRDANQRITGFLLDQGRAKGIVFTRN